MTSALQAADSAARLVALTALDRTLLVEAGAGSGKTSVLAGRVTSLLAAGRHPSEIAAITFTELAAGELRERISRFVGEVAEGHVRADLRSAFPEGPTAIQRAAVAQAREALDELVCTTIHGFCQRLLTPYPVEAKMDPGASVMDQGAAAELFARTFDAWLRERLSGVRQQGDLLVALYVDAPSNTFTLLQDIANNLLKHRGAMVPDLKALPDALHELRVAVQAFRGFLSSLDCVEPETGAIVQELEDLLRATPGSPNEVEILPHLLHLKVPSSCGTAAGAFLSYRKKGKWAAVLKASKSKLQADMLNERAADCYEACCDAHGAVRSYAAGRILQLLASELGEVVARFDSAKRAAGLIDFDDLMLKARDLLAHQPAVRSALGARFKAVLVDEFQDTDRLQSEILWRLCAENPDDAQPWSDWTLRPGSLFLVGDPKQAIYRFRGADVQSYFAARDRLLARDSAARVVITQNFRSVDTILNWVNSRFEAPLSVSGQPGFEALFSLTAAHPDRPAICALPIDVRDTGAPALRDAEAVAVAAVCARMIGALTVRGNGEMRPCRPDDIALLAPTGTELWRYERALEELGIAVSTQAGKGFYRRQEVQDLIALTRTLANSRDTLAFGALLRGPLVGLTEEQLLDAVAELPDTDGRPGRLFLWTPPDQVSHPVLGETLRILQALAQQASSTTPFVLLCQAVEAMQVRPLLRRRQDRTAERALANVDQFLEGARSFDISGLHAFATSMRARWEDAERTMEGRPDTEEQSVSLVTMHSSKGLEWPVVIPVNTGAVFTARASAALDAVGRLHLPVFGLYGPGGSDAIQAEKEEVEREMHRLWYVAATRARDLLLLPVPPSAGVRSSSWMGRIPLRTDELSPISLERLGDARLHRADEPANPQDRAEFVTEAELIAARTSNIRRITPHLAEAGDVATTEFTPLPWQADDGDVALSPPRGSLARGLILHKLLEEVLTGELEEDDMALARRAGELTLELPDAPGATTVSALEMAQSVRRGLALSEIRGVRDRLIAECTVAASLLTDGGEDITLGVADAVVLDPDGSLALVVDWKSDVNPAPATIIHYRSQVGAYLKATRAGEGLIVFLTSGRAEHVLAAGSAPAAIGR